MKKGVSRHPKTRKLANALQISRHAAVGLLNDLWEYTGDYAPQGDIGKFDDQAIADGIDHDGDAECLIESLVVCGWIDRCDTHRLVVHDWKEGCDQWVRKKLSRLKLDFIMSNGASGHRPDTVRTMGGHRPPELDQQGEDKDKEREGKERGMQGGADNASGSVHFPTALDTEPFRAAWAEYEAYRRERHLSKLTQRSVTLKLAELQELGHDQAIAAIRHSIANGWTGIFPAKNTVGGQSPGDSSVDRARARRAEKRRRDFAEPDVPIPDPLRQAGG